MINQFVVTNVYADDNIVTEKTTSSRIGVIGGLIKIFAKFLAINIFPIVRFDENVFTSVPPFIEIGYNETVNIELGLLNTKKNEFQMPKQDCPWYKYRYLNFEVIEYPGGTDSTSWFIDYDPYTIEVKKGTVLKTNITISLTSPPIAGDAIQSGLFTFRIADTWAYPNLWYAPKDTDFDKIGLRFLYFLSAAFVMRYGKYSGTVSVEYKNISILVKVKPYHALKFDTLPLINLKPNQITSIPITLENLGNYNDTYNFRIVSVNKKIVISNPSSITLAPGEQKDIYLGISVPQSAFDYGTLHSVKIEAFSIYDPNVTIDQKTIYFETRGIYFSEINSIGILFFAVIFIFIIAIYMHKRRVYYEKYCSQPDKPWEIPEERAYLDKLKKTDEEKYNEILKMMHEEYKSALLWYKYYIDATIKKIREEKNKEKIKKKSEKLKIKTRPEKKKILKIFEKKKIEPPKVEKKELPKVEKIESPKVWKIKLPKISKIKFPKVHKKDLPKVEKIESPKARKIKLPKISKIKFPKVHKKELPKVEKIETVPMKVDIEAEKEKQRKEQVIQKIKRAQEQQRKKLVKGG